MTGTVSVVIGSEVLRGEVTSQQRAQRFQHLVNTHVVAASSRLRGVARLRIVEAARADPRASIARTSSRRAGTNSSSPHSA
ncbi:MAG: hypothetical protein IPM80_09180 [Proteobacteria bacterium]|nr:hypothetical protein [Pseudomonadota bacterium]